MAGKTAVKEDTKLAWIKAGRRIIVEKGYNHTGIQEILLEVSVPKGSFYHFFSSKEEFGLAIIRIACTDATDTPDHWLKRPHCTGTSLC